MLETNASEVEAALASAGNLNAALKSFLKKEGRAGRSVETFAKSFRTAISRDSEKGIRAYVEQNYPDKQVHFALLLSYAHPSLRDSIVPEVFERYADEFNTTYDNSGEELVVTNPERFEAIARDVVTMIKSGLEREGLPANNFFVYSLLLSIFEPDVLAKVLTVLG